MSFTTPQIPPSKTTEAAEFAKEFKKQIPPNTRSLDLPPTLDPPVLASMSKSHGAYYVSELEDANIVKPFIQDSIKDAIKGLSITIDTTAISQNVFEVLIKHVIDDAKVTPTWTGSVSTPHPGTYFDTPTIFRVIFGVYTADASKLYDSEPGTVLEIAYYAFLTVEVQEAD